MYFNKSELNITLANSISDATRLQDRVDEMPDLSDEYSEIYALLPDVKLSAAEADDLKSVIMEWRNRHGFSNADC